MTIVRTSVSTLRSSTIPLAIVAVAAFLVLAVLRVAHPQAADAAPHLVAPSTSTTDTYLAGCPDGEVAEQEPLTVVTWCASGDQYWTDLQWTSWGAETAEAVGVEVYNECGCAAGEVKSVPVRLTLSVPAPILDGDGARSYQALRVTYVDDRPASASSGEVTYGAVPEGWERARTDG